MCRDTLKRLRTWKTMANIAVMGDFAFCSSRRGVCGESPIEFQCGCGGYYESGCTVGLLSVREACSEWPPPWPIPDEHSWYWTYAWTVPFRPWFHEMHIIDKSAHDEFRSQKNDPVTRMEERGECKIMVNKFRRRMINICVVRPPRRRWWILRVWISFKKPDRTKSRTNILGPLRASICSVEIYILYEPPIRWFLLSSICQIAFLFPSRSAYRPPIYLVDGGWVVTYVVRRRGLRQVRQQWDSILRCVPGLFKIFRSPGLRGDSSSRAGRTSRVAQNVPRFVNLSPMNGRRGWRFRRGHIFHVQQPGPDNNYIWGNKYS